MSYLFIYDIITNEICFKDLKHIQAKYHKTSKHCELLNKEMHKHDAQDKGARFSMCRFSISIIIMLQLLYGADCAVKLLQCI